MNKLLHALAALALSTGLALAQQGPLKWQLRDQSTDKPITQAEVSVFGYHGSKVVRLRTTVDALGQYMLSLPQEGRYTITIMAPGYEPMQYIWQASQKGQSRESILRLVPLGQSSDLSLEGLTLVDDLSEEGATDIGGLLTASRDPFNSAASYTFSSARFRIRGYDNQYSEQMLNGVPMNDLNNGYSVWSLWGGLNDVVRNQMTSETMEPTSAGFGGVGGSNNVLTRASAYGAQRRLTYSNSNRTYTNRAMMTLTTGQLQSGWSLALSLGRRWGDGLHSYVRGQHYDAYSYFVSVEKRLNARHSLGLVAFAAPTRRGVASASTQEAYDLVGSNFYNPNMGRQGGKWRNARERSNHEPILQLSHYFSTPDKRLSVNTTLSYRFGFNSYSSLNWYNAPDPRPDYYRYMPSYFTRMAGPNGQDPETAGIYEELWRSDPNTRYIDWDKLYRINRSNVRDTYDASGKLIASGRKALYMIENRHTDQRELALASSASWTISPSLSLEAGLNLRRNNTDNYAEVGDLLGADYLHDIDKFAERDFGGDPSKVQIDLDHPDRIVRKGDRFGYSYRSLTDRYQLWLNTRYTHRSFDAYAALSLTQTSMQRIGDYRRGLFPNNSKGESDRLGFLDLGAKLGLTYKLSGRHYLVLNGAYLEQAPHFINVFVSPRTRNSYITRPQRERMLSADMSYVVRLPWLRGRLTAFYTRIADKARTMNFYDDTQASFSNYALSGIATRHLGLEAGFEAKLSPTLSATAALALGQYQYDSNPEYIQTIDNSHRTVDQDVVYWKGLNVSGTPQTAATLGLTYRAPWYGTFGVNANYFGRSYISMAPTTRTDRGRAELDARYIMPERLRDGFTVDLYAGYSWRIKRDVFLRFNLSVNNVLNNKSLVSSGFEQLRVRTIRGEDGQSKLYAPFDSKYSYVYGTTFFFNTSLQF